MLSHLTKSLKRVTRSISPENFTGEKGMGGKATEGTGKEASRDLGVGWKVSPSIMIEPQQTYTLAEIEGPGKIRHIWMTCFPKYWRELILEIYWENEAKPAVSVPYGDFFCCGWNERVNVNSLPIVVNPAGGMNSYWEMPFQQKAKIVVKSLVEESFPLYYQIDYSLEEVEECLYFSAYWNRSNPVKYKNIHPLLPKLREAGHYVGTYLAWQVNNNGWWGEGEIKFYLDGDEAFPTICGTGTEDYFGGAWNFEQPLGEYCSYSTMYMGLPQIIKPDGLYQSQQRFGMYRWHMQDPIIFSEDISITIQALGWRSNQRYLPLQDDISSTVFLYLSKPALEISQDFTREKLEII